MYCARIKVLSMLVSVRLDNVIYMFLFIRILSSETRLCFFPIIINMLKNGLKSNKSETVYA